MTRITIEYGDIGDEAYTLREGLTSSEAEAALRTIAETWGVSDETEQDAAIEENALDGFLTIIDEEGEEYCTIAEIRAIT